MLLVSSIHSGGLFRAAVDYVFSSFLLAESNKTRNRNNPRSTRKYLTGKQRGSDMVGRIAIREEGFSAQDPVVQIRTGEPLPGLHLQMGKILL